MGCCILSVSREWEDKELDRLGNLRRARHSAACFSSAPPVQSEYDLVEPHPVATASQTQHYTDLRSRGSKLHNAEQETNITGTELGNSSREEGRIHRGLISKEQQDNTNLGGVYNERSREEMTEAQERMKFRRGEKLQRRSLIPFLSRFWLYRGLSIAAIHTLTNRQREVKRWRFARDSGPKLTCSFLVRDGAKWYHLRR